MTSNENIFGQNKNKAHISIYSAFPKTNTPIADMRNMPQFAFPIVDCKTEPTPSTPAKPKATALNSKAIAIDLFLDGLIGASLQGLCDPTKSTGFISREYKNTFGEWVYLVYHTVLFRIDHSTQCAILYNTLFKKVFSNFSCSLEVSK